MRSNKQTNKQRQQIENQVAFWKWFEGMTDKFEATVKAHPESKPDAVRAAIDALYKYRSFFRGELIQRFNVDPSALPMPSLTAFSKKERRQLEVTIACFAYCDAMFRGISAAMMDALEAGTEVADAGYEAWLFGNRAVPFAITAQVTHYLLQANGLDELKERYVSSLAGRIVMDKPGLINAEHLLTDLLIWARTLFEQYEKIGLEVFSKLPGSLEYRTWKQKATEGDLQHERERKRKEPYSVIVDPAEAEQRGPDPLEEVLMIEGVEQIFRVAQECMTPMEWMIFELRFKHDQSREQIARETNREVGNVDVHLSNARAKLKTKLSLKF